MSRVLITGGTGFLGQKLVERLYSGNELVVMARNEGKLIQLKEQYPKIEIITGDVSDRWIVKKAMKGVNVVIHAAAFKHVGMAETQAFQCIQSNVVGSLNILEESFEVKPDFVVGISTDKVAQVSGVYGATKLCMEALFKEAEQINKKTQYRLVRYGNIIKSTGSFLTKWEDKMKKGEEIILTDPEMTRFFWTIDEATDAVFSAMKLATDATPYLSKMKGIRMGDALKACQKVWGDKSPVKIIGAQPGENFHETIDGKVFSNEVEQYTIDEFAELL